jgi:hypothetical protein
MEEAKKEVAEKPVVKPKKVTPKAKVTKKVAKRKTKVANVNLARGFFVTGLLGILAFTALVNGWLDEVLNSQVEEFLQNDVELLQTSIGLFLIGLFSFTKK